MFSLFFVCCRLTKDKVFENFGYALLIVRLIQKHISAASFMMNTFDFMNCWPTKSRCSYCTSAYILYNFVYQNTIFTKKNDTYFISNNLVKIKKKHIWKRQGWELNWNKKRWAINWLPHCCTWNVLNSCFKFIFHWNYEHKLVTNNMSLSIYKQIHSDNL